MLPAGQPICCCTGESPPRPWEGERGRNKKERDKKERDKKGRYKKGRDKKDNGGMLLFKKEVNIIYIFMFRTVRLS